MTAKEKAHYALLGSLGAFDALRDVGADKYLPGYQSVLATINDAITALEKETPVTEVVAPPFTEPDWMKEDPEFRAWVNSMPDKYWAKYDLGACHLGWHARKTLVSPLEPFTRGEIDEPKDHNGS